MNDALKAIEARLTSLEGAMAAFGKTEIGKVKATSTVWGTTGLTAPIGMAPGTKPNTQACTLSIVPI